MNTIYEIQILRFYHLDEDDDTVEVFKIFEGTINQCKNEVKKSGLFTNEDKTLSRDRYICFKHCNSDCEDCWRDSLTPGSNILRCCDYAWGYFCIFNFEERNSASRINVWVNITEKTEHELYDHWYEKC